MSEKNSDLILNALLGFFSILLVILLFAVTTRFIFPRIETDRTSNQILIGDIIQVEVLNGCGVSGLASRFTNRLRTNGFDVVESGNFETFDITETMVIDRTGNIDNAKKVAKALGVSEKNILQEVALTHFLDATIIIGSDYTQLKLN